MAHKLIKIGTVMATYHPRITTRVDEQTQGLLTQAATLLGMPSMNAFILSAAVEKAKQVLAMEQTLQLSQADALRLANALDTPAQQLPKLQDAAKRYKQHTT